MNNENINKMKKTISVTREQRDFLVKTFDVTKEMVSYALNFHPTQGQSDLARKIRRVALERGGFVMVCAPESEVVHDHDDMMRQYFGNGWMWEADKRTGLLVVMNDKGEEVSRVENASITDIEAVQQCVAAMCRPNA